MTGADNKPSDRQLRERSYDLMRRLTAIGLTSHLYDYTGSGRVSLSFVEFERLLSAAERPTDIHQISCPRCGYEEGPP